MNRSPRKSNFLSKRLASLLLAVQYQRAAELGDQVGELRGALEVAREQLVVHRERMGLVKSHVDDLSARVGVLAGLVADATAERSEPSGSGSDPESAR